MVSIYTSCFMIYSACAPALKIIHNGRFATPCDDPSHFFFSVVHLLMLGISRDEREVTRRKILAFGTSLADDSAVAFDSIDDRVLGQVSAGKLERRSNIIKGSFDTGSALG